MLAIIKANAQTSVSIYKPAANGVASENMEVVAFVNSTVPIDTVWAAVGDRITQLSYSSIYFGYQGYIDLTGLTQGPQQVIITVRKQLVDVAKDTQQFIYDRLPLVTIDAPSPNTVFSDLLHVKAHVSDPGSANCAGKVSFGSYSFSFVNNIDTLIDPAPGVLYTDNNLIVQAIDSAGQTSNAKVMVYRENSPFLMPVFSTAGRIVDFRDHRVLVRTGTDIKPVYSIINIQDSSTSVMLPDTASNTMITQAILCDTGAAIVVYTLGLPSPPFRDHLYYWNETSYTDISAPTNTTPFQGTFGMLSSGNTLLWQQNGGSNARLGVTNLSSLSTTTVGTGNIIDGYLQPDGKKISYSALSAGTSEVFTYDVESGTNSQITTTGSNFYSMVDGNTIAYNHQGEIHIKEGTNDLKFGVNTDSEYPFVFYQLKDQYILYAIMDGKNQKQVYLRYPDKKKIQKVSQLTANGNIERLGDRSRVLYYTGDTRYYTDSVNTGKAVSGTHGQVYFVNGEFYLALQGNLYRYNIPFGIQLPKINSFFPDTARTGMTVIIKGVAFTGATAVSFGHKPAGFFQVLSDSVIRAVVGEGASGAVSVTTPETTASLAGFTYSFYLPADYFKVAVQSAYCKGGIGSVIVKADQPGNYTAVLISDGGSVYHFTDSLNITSFPAGTYQLEISVDGQPDYKQIYTVIITEPAPLSAYIAMNPSGLELDIQLTGAAVYHILLNDSTITTTENKLSLKLKDGVNTIVVMTDKECQGTITKSIVIGKNRLPYPNPFNDKVYLNLGNENVPSALISIYNSTGQLIYNRSYNNVSGVISIDLDNNGKGLYLLKLRTGNTESSFKLMKN
ncbi:T9SS C-terminal target domain-containing protein [Chitinophaga silvisoli]|uniref:T9SS C-terminal target domain-containing protein n=1 Tax=Chitinophaga silvisoli TaxID=2291814 RepID=A0A3E1P1M4_9BACT|nr:T9SS C-terminal target domain-containing protein [Chitinophaga silvisoli]